MIAIITLTTAGAETGPLFDLYSDLDFFTVPFAVNVTKASLIAGYTSAVVPDYTKVVRVKSKGVCINYVDITLVVDSTLYVMVTGTSCSNACTLSKAKVFNLNF